MTPITQRLALALALSTTLASSVIAAAEGNQYFGLQYGALNFENNNGVEWDPNAILGRFGSFLSDNFALEGRIGIGTSSDTVTAFLPGTGIVDVELEIDTLFGLYGVGQHNFGNNSSVYALIGITRGDASISVTGATNSSESDSETDLSYGAGLNIGISNNIGINLEYISYISKSDFDVTAVSFGFVAKF